MSQSSKPVRQVKRGVLSNADKKYIAANFRKKSSELLAKELNRSPDLVERFILEREGEDPNSGKLTALRTRPEWATWQMEFNEEELERFEYYYLKLTQQFDNDDILATEELQIFDYIKLEIRYSRILRELKHHEAEKEAIHQTIQKLQGSRSAGKAKEIDEANYRLQEISRGLKDVAAHCNQIEARKSSLLKELKGTREQRVQQIEGKQSYQAILKSLMHEEVRHRAEEQLNLVKVAVAKEKKRLAKPHRYEDGMIDQPLLTHQTVVAHDDGEANSSYDDGDEAEVGEANLETPA